MLELHPISMQLHTKYEDSQSSHLGDIALNSIFGFGPLVARIVTKCGYSLCLTCILSLCSCILNMESIGQVLAEIWP